MKFSFRKNVVYPTVMLSFPILVLIFCYLAYVYAASQPIYENIKKSDRGWRGKVFKADPILGFSHVAGASGAEILPGSPDIPAQISEDGFRIPVNERRAAPYNRPLILALGCSMTYGSTVHAENAYPYLVAKQLQGTELNAGVCSFGLSQMLIQARELIPKYSPDYVLVQFSSWLVDRALSPYAPTYWGKLPNPFFSKATSQDLEIFPPYYLTAAESLPLDKYRDTPSSLFDRSSFFFDVSLPLYTHEIYFEVITRAKKVVGILPKPTTNHEQVVRLVYNEIAKIASMSKSKLVIVVLGMGDSNQAPKQSHLSILEKIPDAVLVETERALFAGLAEKTEQAYAKKYQHWRDDEIIDRHPNQDAHKVIAKSIVDSMLNR